MNYARTMWLVLIHQEREISEHVKKKDGYRNSPRVGALRREVHAVAVLARAEYCHVGPCDPLFHCSGHVLHGCAVPREPGAGRGVAAPGAGNLPPVGDSEDEGGPGGCSGGEAIPAAATGDGFREAVGEVARSGGGVGWGLAGRWHRGRTSGRCSTQRRRRGLRHPFVCWLKKRGCMCIGPSWADSCEATVIDSVDLQNHWI
jgi:hypothetical protein